MPRNQVPRFSKKLSSIYNYQNSQSLLFWQFTISKGPLLGDKTSIELYKLNYKINTWLLIENINNRWCRFYMIIEIENVEWNCKLLPYTLVDGIHERKANGQAKITKTKQIKIAKSM